MVIASVSLAGTLCVAKTNKYSLEYYLQLPRELDKPVTLTERFYSAVDDRAERTFARLSPIHSMRQMAFAQAEAPMKVNDTALAALSRTLGYGLEEIFLSSDPVVAVTDRLGVFGGFMENSFRDIFQNSMRETVENRVDIHDPEVVGVNVLEPTETIGESRSSQRILWNHKPTYGVGVKGGGPSLFMGGKIKHEKKTFMGWYIRYNFRHLAEHEFEAALPMPLGYRHRITPAITFNPEEPGDMKCALKYHVSLDRKTQFVAGLSVKNSFDDRLVFLALSRRL
jgi:hypothetical protein